MWRKDFAGRYSHFITNKMYGHTSGTMNSILLILCQHCQYREALSRLWLIVQRGIYADWHWLCLQRVHLWYSTSRSTVLFILSSLTISFAIRIYVELGHWTKFMLSVPLKISIYLQLSTQLRSIYIMQSIYYPENYQIFHVPSKV